VGDFALNYGLVEGAQQAYHWAAWPRAGGSGSAPLRHGPPTPQACSCLSLRQALTRPAGMERAFRPAGAGAAHFA